MNTSTTFSSNGSCFRLLALDTSGLVGNVLEPFLRRAGYEVEVATSADEALQLSQFVRWDIVVLDLDIPGVNGLELYARMLCHHDHDRLPVLFVSRMTNPTLQLGLQGADWARLLHKPYDYRQFINCLNRCMQGAEAEVVGVQGEI